MHAEDHAEELVGEGACHAGTVVAADSTAVVSGDGGLRVGRVVHAVVADESGARVQAQHSWVVSVGSCQNDDSWGRRSYAT